MKNEHLAGYYRGKRARIAQGLGMALLLTLLLLLASCGGSSATGSSQASGSATGSSQASGSATGSSHAPASTPVNSNLTFNQAQQQAGHHLLSIPSSLTGYILKRVNAFGPSGQVVYSLFYSIGKSINMITITQVRSLGGLPPPDYTMSVVSVRGTKGNLSRSQGITTLSWVEKGMYITIAGSLSSVQMLALAKSLV